MHPSNLKAGRVEMAEVAGLGFEPMHSAIQVHSHVMTFLLQDLMMKVYFCLLFFSHWHDAWYTGAHRSCPVRPSPSSMLLQDFSSQAIPGRKRGVVYPILLLTFLQLTVIDDKLVKPYLVFMK